MQIVERVVSALSYYIWSFGLPIGGETVPLVVIALLGTGLFMTLRLGFIQVRRLGHGFAVTSGMYDDPAEPGDVSHFQALTTALSATVGIGNIAGVALAIHYGGPGALFWMWVTAALGMAVKYSEVTLAQRYRDVMTDHDPRKWEGSVSGGPMYYIERGLGPFFKPLAVFFAGALGLTAFLTGNGIQANTVADTLRTSFGVPPWITGLVAASVVASVILGGITRIGRVTGILAPLMAAIYLLGSIVILLLNAGQVLPSLQLIVKEAFQPTAGVAGTGAGVFLTTMLWGVKRGLFSNEAGQGSAPIAHAAAKTDEPVSEGVVALVEPFIDTLVICTMTGLVIVSTGAWKDRVPTEITFQGGDSSYVEVREGGGYAVAEIPAEIRVEDGDVRSSADGARLAWHEVPVERLFTNAAQTEPFTGVILPIENQARADDGAIHAVLFGDAVENGAPLTMIAFRKGLGPIGPHIVLLSVLLFAISTAIAWSYYGDRCANYLFGPRAILPYKAAFVTAHFLGAVVSLSVAWTLGDVFLGIVILPNLLAILLLSGRVKDLTDSYFARKPWIENAEVARRARAARKAGHRPPPAS
ncbi:MAG: sodium:alanine symporter family protein [Acidobacteria bacterium]|jgi:AGCS family alanine or glycine:cation symporter|nr:sodium:alanine symporter family protein [Acidobacteriota bacterium]